MIKVVFSWVFLLVLFFSFHSNASEYRVSTIGTETLSVGNFEVTGINDKGQVFGRCIEKEYSNNQKNRLYFFDDKNGIVLIDGNDPQKNYWLNPSAANNNGYIVGTGYGPTNSFLWTKALGLRSLDLDSIFKNRLTPNDTNNFITPIALNDLGQLIGNYYTHSLGYRPFLWDNGVVSDMGVGSEFVNEFEALGYHVMDLQLTTINNKGELAGYFKYGKYNEKKKAFVAVGYKTFFWNGIPNILPLPSDTEYPPEIVKLNYHGVVLVRNSMIDRLHEQSVHTTYLWSLEKDLQILPNFYGNTLNDSSVVLGFIKENVCCRDTVEIEAIWRDGQVITLAELLGVSSVLELAPPYSDGYEVERIDRAISINNKGQIACRGYIWGEYHPCILEPSN